MKLTIYSRKFGGREVLIDDEDYELILKYHWLLSFEGKSVYAVGYVPGDSKQVRMHRLIMGVLDTPSIHIDHIDRNSLNNQKSNLRRATIAENSRNVGANRTSTTGFKGVFYYTKHAKAGWYAVRIKVKNKAIFGGYFKDPVEAAKKYNELAIKYHGEFAYLNKIPQ